MNAFSRCALVSAVVGRGSRSTTKKTTTTQRKKKETTRRFLRICVVGAFIISLSLSECFDAFFPIGVVKEFPENKRALLSSAPRVKRGARLYYDANEKKSKCRARFLSRRRRPR